MRFAPLFVTSVLVLAACGQGDESDTATSSSAPVSSGSATTAAPGPDDDPVIEGKPIVEIPEGDAPTELVTEDLVVGDGDEVTAGSLVEVHYVGVNFDDGEQFDASWDRGETFVTAIPGQVIQGWNEGILGMKAGGQRQLVIPPEKAYGTSGHELAGKTLVFVVDVVNVFAAEGPDKEPAIAVPAEPPTELKIEVLTAGDGAKVESGQTIVVNYVGATQSDGAVFDSSWKRSEPVQFPIGVGRVIAGWDQGLVGQNVGSRVQLTIPSDLAYGPAGRDPIGPNESLVFIIDILGLFGG